MKTDVLILADVFEAFHDMYINNYNLDPAHSLTSPNFAWHAALKMSEI